MFTRVRTFGCGVFYAAVLILFGIAGCEPRSVVDSDTNGAHRNESHQPSIVSKNLGYKYVGGSTDSTVSHVFEIPNKTAVPIRLSIGEKSCGCTSCELSKDVLEPGEIGQATVTMRLQATTGPRRETVVVQSDNEVMPRVHLTLACDVVANLTVSFPNHQSTTLVRPGTESTIRGAVVAIRPASDSMVPVEIRITNPKFRLKQLDMNEESQQAGVRKIINFEVSMTCPESDDSEFADSFIGRIVARAGSDEAGSDIVFNVDAPIRLTPKRVFLNANNGGSNRPQLIVESDEPFSISRPEAEYGPLEISAEYGTVAQKHRLVVDLSKNVGSDKPRRLVVSFKTDHRAQPVLRVPVYVLWPSDSSP